MPPLPTKATSTGEELMKYYRDMQTIRRMEIVLDTEYKVECYAQIYLYTNMYVCTTRPSQIVIYLLARAHA